jgi:hypothetical protein
MAEASSVQLLLMGRDAAGTFKSVVIEEPTIRLENPEYPSVASADDREVELRPTGRQNTLAGSVSSSFR